MMRADARRPQAKFGFFREFRARSDKGTGAADTYGTALKPLTDSVCKDSSARQ